MTGRRDLATTAARSGQGAASVAYGMLPPAVFTHVKQRFFAHIQARRANVVRRTE